MATSTVWYYFSPTTPGNAGWAENITSAIRLGSISGLAGEAEMGAVGTGNVVLDDPAGTVGHLNDGIVGLKQIFVNENACPVGNRRLWTGYVADRRYHRGQQDSLITGVARKIDVTLQDLNAFLSFRVFAPTASDPTSDFVRPAETDLQRVQALLTTVDFISTTLFDVGYIPTTGGVAMDANDYTGQRPIDVLNDCAQVSGRNFWVKYHEATSQLVLWYDLWTSDGSTTLVYDSALRLTNVASEHDGTTTFAITPDAVEVLDPSRLVAGVYLPYTGGTAYGTKVSTSYSYAWRDSVMSSSYVKTAAKAASLVSRYLNDNDTEDSRISCTVQLPLDKVTGIHEGMRLQVHFTHLPAVQSGFTWTRVLQRTIRQDQETDRYYWLDLELSSLAPPCLVSEQYTFNTATAAVLWAWEVSGVRTTPVASTTTSGAFATLPPANPALADLTLPDGASQALLLAGYFMGNATDSDGPWPPSPNFTSSVLTIDQDKHMGFGCGGNGDLLPETVSGRRLLSSPAAGNYGIGLTYTPGSGACGSGGGVPAAGGIAWGGGAIALVSDGNPISVVQTTSVTLGDGFPTITTTFASPLTAGNLVVAWVASRITGTTISPPAGWTSLAQVVNNGRAARLMYYEVVCP